MDNNELIRILIADDHMIVLIGVQHFLEENFTNVSVDIVERFDEAIAKVQQCRYDILILDINLPGGNRLGMIPSIRIRQSDTRILMFSALEEMQYAVPYLKAGADGFISKSAGKDELYKAVLMMIQKKKYVSPDVHGVYIEKFINNEMTLSWLEVLTKKELEVALLLSAGLSTKQIASKLSLSLSAVSGHRCKIFEKLDVPNVFALKDLLSHAN